MVVEVILLSVSIAISIVALYIAVKNKGVKEIITHEKIVETEPVVEHPFAHDGKGNYVLDGNLEVTGIVTLYKKGGKK